MSERHELEPYGELTEPTTLKIQRVLPGPIERAWAFLTESPLRRQWLAAGDMVLEVGAPFELIWRNDELTDPSGPRPPGATDEHRMRCRITALEPPRSLVFTWGSDAEVHFALAPQGDEVLFTVTHRRVSERSVLLKVSAGWHTHLDILAARLRDETPKPFWDVWTRLESEYDRRMPR